MNFQFQERRGTKGLSDAISCFQNLLGIPEKSIPLSRGLGVSWAKLSSVPEDMENDYATEIIEKAERYEPRLEVTEVTFEHDGEGGSRAMIEISPAESEDEDYE